jgi:hypothetical protein
MPKGLFHLTDAEIQQASQLRAVDPKIWTYQALGDKFGVTKERMFQLLAKDKKSIRRRTREYSGFLSESDGTYDTRIRKSDGRAARGTFKKIVNKNLEDIR